MAELNFNAEAVDPASSYDPLPVGWYPCIATESEFKSTQKGNGQYLQIVFEVIDGQHKGRKLWARLNLDNPNRTAVEIAERELSAICRAVGVMRPKDSRELHGKALMVKVGMRRRADTNELSNEIKGYKAAEKSSYSAPASTAQPARNEFSDDTPPWQRA